MQISLKQLQPEVTQKIDKNEESVGLLKNRIDNMVNTTHGNEIIVEIYQVYDSIEDMLADAENVADDLIVSVNDTENYTVLIYKRDSNFTKDEAANNEDGFHFLSRMNNGVIVRGPQGQRGEDGKGFKILGVYESAEAMSDDRNSYEDGDIVILKEDGKALMYSKDSFVLTDSTYDKKGFKYIIDLAELAAIKGDKGDPGQDGEKGDKGDDGFTPTISADTSVSGQVSLTIDGKDTSETIVIKDGQNGKSAYDVAVDNGWDDTLGEAAWLLSLKGSKGDAGEQGIQGEQGIKGDTGAKGDKGDKGDTGEKGEKGERGEGFAIVKIYDSTAEMIADATAIDEGKMVAVVSSGSANIYMRDPSIVAPDAGSSDEDGYRYVTNLADAAAIKGDKGDKGDKGEKGDTGAKGDKGDTGSQGIQGIQGIKGDAGQDGVSPTVSTTSIIGGTTVTISDASGSHTFNVMNGEKGEKGDLPTLDAIPTDGSMNGVTSSGTFNAIKIVQDSVNNLEKRIGNTSTKVSPTLEYVSNHTNKYVHIRCTSQAHIQFIDDFGHYVLGMDSGQLMWAHCHGTRKAKSQITFYAIQGVAANSGVYFKAVAATPVVLYNSLNTTIECVTTLPSEAKVVPWTKSSEGFWTASKEDIV